MATLTVGTHLQTRAPLGPDNGSEVVPAVVTKVWDRSTVLGHPVWAVNLWVFLDGPVTAWRYHVLVFEDEDAASTVPGWNAWLMPSEGPDVH